MRGPIYLAHIFLLRDFSIWVLRMRTRLLCWKLKSFEGAEVLLLKPTWHFESGLVDFGIEDVDVSGAFL
jgi:hypothetical protein